MSERLRGQCHCGNITFTFAWPADRKEIPARACDCEFCVKHGGRWTSNPDGGFTLAVADSARETIYRFGTKTADFHICATCGVVPIVTCDLEGRRFAVVNVNTFANVDASRLVPRGISFEEEEPGDRLERRRKTWTPEG